MAKNRKNAVPEKKKTNPRVSKIPLLKSYEQPVFNGEKTLGVRIA